MINLQKKLFPAILVKNEKGQTLVEYALILVLIAIVVIVILTALGLTTNNTFSTVNSALTTAAS